MDLIRLSSKFSCSDMVRETHFPSTLNPLNLKDILNDFAATGG
jgi:hypothetical protein